MAKKANGIPTKKRMGMLASQKEPPNIETP
jgi:hypothetical protein